MDKEIHIKLTVKLNRVSQMFVSYLLVKAKIVQNSLAVIELQFNQRIQYVTK